MSVSIGEPLLSDYSVYELPAEDDNQASCIALGARVEFLEVDKSYVQSKVTNKFQFYFRVEQIADNDSLIKFYTGFDSYSLFLSFFEFLGPAVYNLNYWGDNRKTSRRRKNRVLSPLNQP